ncbi:MULTISPECIES: serine hydrolase domain-containing protein [Caulobacter]|uniref:Penicillin-binding protein, beta-lactamase class C n=1 Tax=Caulobacter vibrioides OR37 TaxID=1292034 RepID=R0EEV2_CAUVI|nr:MULTISPECIES: serine hydrolase domain-containing protein [Caulobacter]ENZ83968.1 penicillin-binding protein, beta-lactamase class C [Caulobacter vibrioides OR37]MBQ1562357.1 beta-lactamase family protein [Caulobacter sp.]
MSDLVSAFLPTAEDLVLQGMERQKVPGCALALIEGGETVAVRVFGLADAEKNEPVTEETRFSLQSISKSYAALAVMVLVEEGRLDLDQPINRYLKRFRVTAAGAFDLDLVTPRRLLSHHAGVTEAGFRGVGLDQPGFTLIDAMQGRLPPPTEAQERHYAYWGLRRDDDLVAVTHPPGEGWRYSNAGFGLLELAIEDITGLSYAAFVEERLLRPLGLSRTGFERIEGLPFASPHDREGRVTADYRWLCRAAGGAYATVGDLATFAGAEIAGGEGTPPGRGVVSPASLAILHTPHGDADSLPDLPMKAGLGHILVDAGGVPNVHHSGGSIGWRSIYSIFPTLGSGICMVMNGEAANELWQPVVRAWTEAVLKRRA